MGRDIDLVDPETGEIITHIYISGNFWKYEEEYWFDDVSHLHTGKRVHFQLLTALSKLMSEGIYGYDIDKLPHDFDGWKADKMTFATQIKFFIREIY
jgi:hypothetical protein